MPDLRLLIPTRLRYLKVFLPLPTVLALAASTVFAQPNDSGASNNPGTNFTAASTVASTNSMEVLDDSRRLNVGDRLSYRVVEERKEPVPLLIADSGEVEVPLIGRIQGSGKTCKQLARDIQKPLEREYFFKATVIVGLDFASARSRGKIYVTGQVKVQGAQEIPGDEDMTLSRAILKGGGFADFANKRKVKVIHKTKNGGTETVVYDLEEIMEKGRVDKDPVLRPDDLVIVPERLVNF